MEAQIVSRVIGGAAEVAGALVSRQEFEDLKETTLFIEEAECCSCLGGEVLDAPVEEIRNSTIDGWLLIGATWIFDRAHQKATRQGILRTDSTSSLSRPDDAAEQNDRTGQDAERDFDAKGHLVDGNSAHPSEG